MMRDANSHHTDDPAHRWAALLEGLLGHRRDTVIKALRNSVDSGYPANADGVRTLVAYAQGHISARQYVAQILESLGFRPAAYAPAPVPRSPEPWHQVRDADPWRAPARTQDPWHDVLSASYTPPVAPIAPVPPVMPSAPKASWRDSWNEPVRETSRQEGLTITQTRRTTRKQAVQAYVTGQIPVEEFLRISRVIPN